LNKFRVSAQQQIIVCVFVFVLLNKIFILLSRESDGGAIFWTNPHPLRSCPYPSFPVVSLTSTTEFAACLKPPNRDNYPTVLYPRT